MDGAWETTVEVKLLTLYRISPAKDQRVYIDVEAIILTALNICFHQFYSSNQEVLNLTHYVLCKWMIKSIRCCLRSRDKHIVLITGHWPQWQYYDTSFIAVALLWDNPLFQYVLNVHIDILSISNNSYNGFFLLYVSFRW